VASHKREPRESLSRINAFQQPLVEMTEQAVISFAMNDVLSAVLFVDRINDHLPSGEMAFLNQCATTVVGLII
jgi:hypothetical protein